MGVGKTKKKMTKIRGLDVVMWIWRIRVSKSCISNI